MKERHPELISKLDNIRLFRNKIAHLPLDTSDEFLEKNYTDRIKFNYYEKGVEKHLVVTEECKQKRLNGCARVILSLLEIQREVKRQNEANQEN